MEEPLVFHDGEYLPIKSIVKMAMNAPDYHTAEHYIVSLLYCAAMCGDRKLLEDCQEVRRHFGVLPYPELHAFKGDVSAKLTKEEVRSIFNRQNDNTQRELLCEAVKIMIHETDETGKAIFWQKQHWMAVYLVLRDGLGIRCSQTAFARYANSITPLDCPESLRIGTSTMTNFSKTITEEKPYYEMKHNPFGKVCNAFWNIIESLVHTRI